ncbi:FKBP-type peptidyl-prolyl cis-trans isomerase [Thiomicrospira microaerophila]|uniref:FKBP-type peptidyl-prolyl cis-trans isomerase n=1 Tax=Thiomicrospira microaerophila TaxID=406020 RepID=UPI0005CA037A|nr:FKBP-type peptidyl-prolyl cis-trans isomerase [Thiomicrospira microaerophila]
MQSLSRISRHLLLASSLAFSSATFADLSTAEQRASYAIGVDLANNLTSQGIELSVEAFLQGLGDTLRGQSLALTEQEMANAIREFTRDLEIKQNERLASIAEENLLLGQAFLAENKKKPGIVTLDSGLQYRVIEQGKGAHPTDQDRIIAHYTGRLIDGTEFDSSYNRGTPIEFELGGVIAGWQQALKLMKPGAKWEIFVPTDLAYGTQGAGNVIGPNEVLIFDIHFIVTAVND